MSRILVIDDEDHVLFTLEEILTGSGHIVKIARNGEEGIQLFEGDDPFDLVITDINMPLKNGNDVARHIRNSKNADTPIVAITGYTEMIQRDSFNYVLKKPFRLENLVDVVKSFTPKSASDTCR
jgi:CheY-like chemotaxis protein